MKRGFARRPGFTLLELLMAIALVAIISVVGVTQFTDYSRDAKQAVTRERMNSIRVAIKGDARMVSNGQFVRPGFEAHLGSLPGVLTGKTGIDALSELVTNPGAYNAYDVTTKLGWHGPYISADGNWYQDGWGEDFRYDPGERKLTSSGPDRDFSAATDNIILSL